MNGIFYVIVFSFLISITYPADFKYSNRVRAVKNNLIQSEEKQGKERLAGDGARRQDDRARAKSGDSSAESSSSQELPEFKKEWRDLYWLKKQYEILNKSTAPVDTVNMIAARPWGVRCGDPSMHDMPWGTCMLPMECEAEFRIWRGDFFCGRTQFVCCAIEETSYDLYKGFDASFASSFETDTEERNSAKNSKEKKEKAFLGEKKRRQRDRKERKKIMKKKILQIIREVRKLLNSIYRNGTKEKRKKTKQMKQFIKELKTKYKKDRQAMKDIHEIEFIKIDSRLRERLEEIRLLNVNFMKNATFRDVILNGTLTLSSARMLVEAYPELESYFGMRRSMSPSRPDYVDYDVEYGLLYY